jgi:carboxylesterase type B
MAGMTSDEASGMLNQMFPDVHNLTVEEFKFLVSTINQMYHGLDAENVTQFYFKNIDPKDPGASVRAFEVFIGDLSLKCSTYLFAKQFATNAPSKNVYSYELTSESQFMTNATGCPPGKVCHSADIPFVFGRPFINPDLFSHEETVFSRDIMKMWTNFAKTGYKLIFKNIVKPGLLFNKLFICF